MPTVTIPLVGSFTSRATYLGSIDYDQNFKNVFFEFYQNQATNSGVVYVAKRPGLGSKTLIDSGLGTSLGIYVASDGSKIQIFGSNVYRNATLIGSLGSVSWDGDAYIEEIEINQTKYFIFHTTTETFYAPFVGVASTNFTADTTSGSPNLTNFSSPSQVYVGRAISGTGIPAGARVQSVSGSTVVMTDNATANGTGVTVTLSTIAKIIDSDYTAITSITGNFVQLDGYIFVADNLTSRIYNSDLNTIVDWGASSFITANIFPDRLKTIIRYKNNIAAFGNNSIEFFYNAGNATGSPLARSSQLTSNIGLAYTNAITTVVDVPYFMGATEGGYAGVFRLDGYTPVKISNQFVDRNLGQSGGTMSSFTMNGLNYVLCSNTYRTYVYCVEQNLWTEIDFLASGAAIFKSSGEPSKNIVYFSSNGYQYEMNGASSVYLDDTSDITTQIRTIRSNFGTSKRKSVSRVSLNCDKQSSGTATLEFSDDDYATWNVAGSFDLTKMNPKIHRCGSFVGGRAWRITHTSNAPFRAESIEIDYEIGQH